MTNSPIPLLYPASLTPPALPILHTSFTQILRIPYFYTLELNLIEICLGLAKLLTRLGRLRTKLVNAWARILTITVIRLENDCFSKHVFVEV